MFNHLPLHDLILQDVSLQALSSLEKGGVKGAASHHFIWRVFFRFCYSNTRASLSDSTPLKTIHLIVSGTVGLS